MCCHSNSLFSDFVCNAPCCPPEVSNGAVQQALAALFSRVVFCPCNILEVSGFQFEGLPTYPDVGRLWEVVDKYQVTKFYTAPTAIRMLMKYGSEPVQR